MRKEQIVKKLREHGYRITKQRQELLDIILESECSSGTATVYRMVNILEEIGAIDRKNMYRVAETEHNEGKKGYVVVLNDHTTRYLSEKNLNMVLRAGLRIYGYLEDQDVSCITVKMQGRGKKGVY